MKYSKTITLLLLFLFILFSKDIYAQNEGTNWFFGHNAGLNFNSSTPIAITGGSLNTYEGCSSISDANGALLFYTDGQNVYDHNHNLMPNGSGLLGNPSSTQSSIIVQRPGNNSEFYIFTVDYDDGTNGINYSKVDMSLNAGLGDIVTSEKNIFLAGPSAEKITAVCHGSEDAIWVIAPLQNTNTFHAWLVDGAGVNSTPVTSNTGLIIPKTYGALKGSLSGTKLALALGHNSPGSNAGSVLIYDFDNNTGTIINTHNNTHTDYFRAYAIAFSPNEQYLYMSTLGRYTGSDAKVFQFDANDFSVAPTLIGTQSYDNDAHYYYPGGALQLAPDGNIYMAGGRSYPAISVITSPDSPNPVFSSRSINLGGKLSDIGLPSFNQCLYAPLGSCVKILNENFVCNPDGSYTYSFDFIYNGVDEADNFIVTDLQGNTLFNTGGLSLNQGDTYSTVSFTTPISIGDFCFRLRLFGVEECCHMEHCIYIPECNPCDSISMQSVSLQNDDEGCCHSIDLTNNLSDSYFTNITSTIITPNVNFSNPVANGGWSVSGSGNVLNWTAPSNYIPSGTHTGVMDFCLDNITLANQIPQTVVFDWWATTENGENIIACSDTLYFNCTSCLYLGNASHECLDDGSFDVSFTVWNASNPAHDATHLRIVPLISGICLDGSTAPANLPLPNAPLPSGSSDNLSMNLSDCGAGFNPGDFIPFKAILMDNAVDLSWCCHVDTIWAKIPNCKRDCSCNNIKPDVDQGFTVIGPACNKLFTPIALESCDSVLWTSNETVIGTSFGNEPFAHSFSSGFHTVCMNVYRYEKDGTVCKHRYCLTINVICTIFPPDPQTSFPIILISPNPIKGITKIKVNLETNQKIAHSKIMDMNGRQKNVNIQHTATSPDLFFDANELSVGAYLLEVVLDNGERVVEKFLKVN